MLKRALRKGLATMLVIILSLSSLTMIQVDAAAEIVGGVTKEDPGFTYEGTSRDWWPEHDYYYLESPDIKFTVGTVRNATHDPDDWSSDASGNDKWGSLTPGHMMDAVPRLTMQENLDYSIFVLSDDLGVTPEDEANGKYMEWSWWHPLTMLQMPDISIENDTIVANGDWYANEKMTTSVRYSIVEGTPLIKMEITLNNQTGEDFNGDFGYIIDPDQPGEQHTYVPGKGWVYSQVNKPIRSGWTDNYVFNGVGNKFTGKTAHAIIWPDEQQPKTILNNAIFEGVWFDATIPNGESRDYVIYHMPHVPGPAEQPFAVAEFWAKFIKNQEDPEDYGSITGTMTDESGAPVAFTDVEVKDVNGDSYAKAVTNSDGQYQVYVRNGIYEISPVSEEYSGESRTVEVGDTKRVQADFVMKKYADVAVELPENLTVDSPFDITVTVKNLTDQALNNVTVDLQPPYFVNLLDEKTVEIPVLEAESEGEIEVRGVAWEGGRAQIKALASTALFNATGKSSFDIQGAGYYGGDNHSHTNHSDGVDTVADNADNVYRNRLLSWVWNTEHNTISQKQDAKDVTRSYEGRFLSLTGTEITTSLGHALAYGFDSTPRFDIDGTHYTWQDSIDDVTGQDGLFYIAHPFEQTYAFQTPYEWEGFTGVEVWNGNWHALDDGVNERAFRFWDEINIRGDGKYYGIANSDGHTKDKVGDPYIKGAMPELTEENVLELLKTGAFYGSNGPDLRFSIDGVEMGGTLKLENPEDAVFNIQAHDSNSNLTNVRVIKYPITGNIADYTEREIVFEEDLTSLKTNTFVKEIHLPVTNKEFYRLEVQSEKAQENSSGIGPLTGTGVAFSNPIWIESSEDSNATAIEAIAYENHYEVENRFGIKAIEVVDDTFDPSKLDVTVSEGATVTERTFSELNDEDTRGILQLIVTAKDGSQKTYKFLVNAVSVSHMQTLVAHFEEEGEFANQNAARLLQTHLTAVGHYEGQALMEKAIKHMKGFQLLIEHQKENAWISGEAYHKLKTEADALIEKWEKGIPQS